MAHCHFDRPLHSLAQGAAPEEHAHDEGMGEAEAGPVEEAVARSLDRGDGAVVVGAVLALENGSLLLQPHAAHLEHGVHRALEQQTVGLVRHRLLFDLLVQLVSRDVLHGHLLVVLRGLALTRDVRQTDLVVFVILCVGHFLVLQHGAQIDVRHLQRGDGNVARPTVLRAEDGRAYAALLVGERDRESGV